MRIAVYCGSRGGAHPKYVEAARELGTWIGKSGHTLVYGAGFLGIMGAVSAAVQESGGHIIGVIPQFMVDQGWEKKDLKRIREEDLPDVEAAWAKEKTGTASLTTGNCPIYPAPDESDITRSAKTGEDPDLERCANAPGGPSKESGTAVSGPGDVMLITSSMSTRKAKMMELADVYIALPGGPGTLEEIAEVISLAAVHQHEKPCILLNQDGFYDPLRLMYEHMLEQDFTVQANLTHVHYAADVQEVLRLADGAGET